MASGDDCASTTSEEATEGTVRKLRVLLIIHISSSPMARIFAGKVGERKGFHCIRLDGGIRLGCRATRVSVETGGGGAWGQEGDANHRCSRRPGFKSLLCHETHWLTLD